MKYWIAVAVSILSVAEIRADHRFTFQPSLEIAGVSDDNLNYSATQPLSDYYRRITPALGLLYQAPRLSIHAVGGLDAEEYANHPSMSDSRAREQASMLTLYQAAPRLRLGLNTVYLRTNTLADLNLNTAVAAPRVRAEQTTVSGLAAFRVSPKFTVTLQPASYATIIGDGTSTRTQVQAVILQDKVSERDLFNIHYEYWDSSFRGVVSRKVITQYLVGRWIREFEHNRVTVLMGPRITDGRHSIDFTGIVAHAWKTGSIDLKAQRTQALIAGYAGLADSETLQTTLRWTPNRRLTAYVIPALYRTTSDSLQAVTQRVGVGARYALTPFIDAEVAYKTDDQNGSIDPLQPVGKFLHSTFLLRLGFRMNEREGTR